MDTLCMQDWVTIKGAAEVASVTQSSGRWLEVGAYQDIVFYLDVKQADPNTQLNYQTAPVAEESAFLTIKSSPASLSVGVRSDAVLSVCSTFPLARYVRWKLTNPASSAWGITFRIWVAAYALL